MNDEQRKCIEIWRRDAMGMATGGIKEANQRIIELADLLLASPADAGTGARECCEKTREAAAEIADQVRDIEAGESFEAREARRYQAEEESAGRASLAHDIAKDIRSMPLPTPTRTPHPDALLADVEAYRDLLERAADAMEAAPKRNGVPLLPELAELTDEIRDNLEARALAQSPSQSEQSERKP